MSQKLAKTGLQISDLSKIIALEPDVAKTTTQLNDDCKEFMHNITNFQQIADGFIALIDGLGQEVEREKMKAIGARNLLKSMAKRKDAQQQQLQALIIEKSTELERLRVQHQSLVKTEAEQQEIIDHLLMRQ